MATTPIEDEEQPTVAQRVREAVTAPVTQRKPRVVALLILAAGLGALAPLPFGPLAAMVVAGISWEVGRARVA